MALAGLLFGALRAPAAARNLDPRHRLHATLFELETLRSALAGGRSSRTAPRACRWLTARPAAVQAKGTSNGPWKNAT